MLGHLASPEAHDRKSVVCGHKALSAAGFEKTDILEADFFKKGQDDIRLSVDKRGDFCEPPRIWEAERGRTEFKGEKFMPFEISKIRVGRWKACD